MKAVCAGCGGWKGTTSIYDNAFWHTRCFMLASPERRKEAAERSNRGVDRRVQIADDVAAFLANGGSVTVVPRGVSGIPVDQKGPKGIRISGKKHTRK